MLRLIQDRAAALSLYHLPAFIPRSAAVVAGVLLFLLFYVPLLWSRRSRAKDGQSTSGAAAGTSTAHHLQKVACDVSLKKLRTFNKPLDGEDSSSSESDDDLPAAVQPKGTTSPKHFVPRSKHFTVSIPGDHRMHHGRMLFRAVLSQHTTASAATPATPSTGSDDFFPGSGGEVEVWRLYSAFRKLHKETETGRIMCEGNHNHGAKFLRRKIFSSEKSKAAQRSNCLRELFAKMAHSDKNLELLADFFEVEKKLLGLEHEPTCTEQDGTRMAAENAVLEDGVWNGCGCDIIIAEDAIDQRIAKHYKKGGWMGAVSGAFGDKKTMYCHHITKTGEFAVTAARRRGLTFASQEEVWSFLEKRCAGRFTLKDWGTKTMGCGGVVEKDHDNTCNAETCLFIANGLTCPTPKWAFKK